MKILVKKSFYGEPEEQFNEVKYSFPDDYEVVVLEDKTITPNFNISDMNTENSLLIEDVNNLPEDFVGNKYLYEDGVFTPNPNYVEPVIEEPPV